MKILISVLLAAGTGFAAAYFFVSSQNESAVKAERAKVEAQWQAEKEKLESELAVAKNKKPKIEQVKTEVQKGKKSTLKQA